MELSTTQIENLVEIQRLRQDVSRRQAGGSARVVEPDDAPGV
jgi:hypothetical protein